jgi:hypothetical protein
MGIRGHTRIPNRWSSSGITTSSITSKAKRRWLSDGPDSGLVVVSVGAEELYGAEVEFEEE